MYLCICYGVSLPVYYFCVCVSCSVFLVICESIIILIYMSPYFYIYLFIKLSFHLSTYIFPNLSIYLSIHLLVKLFICLPSSALTSLSISIYMSIYLFACTIPTHLAECYGWGWVDGLPHPPLHLAAFSYHQLAPSKRKRESIYTDSETVQALPRPLHVAVKYLAHSFKEKKKIIGIVPVIVSRYNLCILISCYSVIT